MQSVTYRASKYDEHLYGGALVAGMLCFSLLVALGVGLWWLEIPWIASAIGYIDGKAHFLWPWLALSAAAAPAYALYALWKSPDRNFLVLDDAGLTHVRLGIRRKWSWRDLDAITVRTHLLGEQAAMLMVSGRVGGIARIALFLVGRLASSSRLTVKLANYYETSIDDVAITLNDYRDRALGIARPARTAEASMNTGEQDPRATVYRMTPYKLYRKKNDLLVPLLLCVIVAAIGGEFLFAGMSFLRISIFAVFVAILIAMAVRRIRHGSQDDNFLRLDDDGVTYVSWRSVVDWRWSDLPVFEIRGSGKLRRVWPRRIAIGKHVEAWRRFRLRPTVWDDYDAPLDEIAATLNAYRERALDGGAA